METQVEKQVDYQSSMEQLRTLIKAHVPYIWVTTYEESRFIDSFFSEVVDAEDRQMYTWSSYQGIVPYSLEDDIKKATGKLEGTWNPTKGLEAINAFENNKQKRGSVFVLKDFHTVLAQPIPRMLRDMYQELIYNQKTLVIVSPCLAHGPSGSKPGMEPTLDKQMVVVNYELPSREFIDDHVKSAMFTLQETATSDKKKKVKFDYSNEEYNKFAMALQGLTGVEIDNAIGTSLSHLRRLDEKKLLLEKKQIIQRSEILEYIGQSTSMSEVGGLDLAKQYFSAYSNQFSPEAKEFGVEPLRGVLLTGIPGAGKSLIVKAVSEIWSLPLLRLDVGKVMSGLVGSSEQKMREVISQVETLSPAILWIDEIEKSLSGTKSSGMSDGGTLARVFGTLLTAMEERMQGVVTLATANDISALPPELIRRFNEVLFVDLPLPPEREEIFHIHLNKRGRDAEKLGLDIDALVKATHLFTGSEIEKAIKEGIARAFTEGHKDVNTEILLEACTSTKPIAKIMKEKIDSIRDWARDRARYASSLAEAANAPGMQKVTTKNGKELDLASDLDDLDEVVTEGKGKKKKNFTQLQHTLDD